MAFPQQAFTFSSAASPAWPSGGRERDGLCSECGKLDLEQAFARAYALYEGARRGKNTRTLEVYKSEYGPPYLGHFYYVTSLGNRLARATSCRLCNFFKQTTPTPGSGTYKLLAFCSSESYLFDPPRKNARGAQARRPWGELDHNVFMAVVSEVPLIPKTGVPLRWFETELPKSGPIYRLTWRQPGETRVALPRSLQPQADIGLVGSWVDLCRQTHRCCSPKKPAGATLPGFRAINCIKTPPVVEDRPWSERYVALSYVWGPPSEDWSPTILDAVQVTRRLGEQYLWVDRLCINQSDSQEKQFLISKMDAIYEGAEFTIVAAVGDARTGLPGVTTKPRKPQPRVELPRSNQGVSGWPANNLNASVVEDRYVKLLGITTHEYETTCNDGEWTDLHRYGFRSKSKLDLAEFKKEKEIMERYNISRDHLEIFQDFADDYNKTIDQWMVQMQQMSQRRGIPLQRLGPHILKEIALSTGMPPEMAASIKRRPAPPTTRASKIDKNLPPGENPSKTILVSTLEDPRVTVRNSEWATRGWTYQEGVLSNRRLVFTEHQVYWECRGMAVHESLDLPLKHLRDPSGTRMPDYFLSGVFDGDLHSMPELQYGFHPPAAAPEISEQVLKLDSHLRAFSSRNISYDSDALNAFLGVAARYVKNDSGLSLLLGMPIWTGVFANGRPGLQDTFALSISTWKHHAPPVAAGAEMYVANRPRRTQFPSWTWVGWKGWAELSGNTATDVGAGGAGVVVVVDQGDGDDSGESVHVDFFATMMSAAWVRGIQRRLWSAETMLHAADGSEATVLTGRAPVAGVGTAPGKTWLLSIREPLVLQHMYLMQSAIQGEWRRLMGKRVQVHLSVPLTEEQLTAGHTSGEMVTVLVFASAVPFIFNGTARYLILRQVDAVRIRWERIGRLIMTMEEREMDAYKSSEGMVAGLPVRKFGRDIVLI